MKHDVMKEQASTTSVYRPFAAKLLPESMFRPYQLNTRTGDEAPNEHIFFWRKCI